MDSAHRDKVNALTMQALAMPADQRTAFLDRVCGKDAALREELSSIIASSQETGYREIPSRADVSGGMTEQDAENKESGDLSRLSSLTFANYKVLEQLGQGGMGDVYKGIDTRLGRTVALKFLSPELTRNKDSQERFEREARAASALDHVNICTIYEINQTETGQTFIAMACYEGETLKKKIERDRLPIEETIGYVTQVAEGLSQAHEAGIVHRDIKPANVIVTDKGVVKILDFGLAKVGGIALTKTGMTQGTVMYMSPEQARGEDVDHRTDIWSLGVVFYELLTGKRPFQGEYEQAVIYSVLNVDPTPIVSVQPDVPTDIARVVARCLEKDPAKRYASATDLLADLMPDSERAQAPRLRISRTAQILAFGAAAVLALLMALTPIRGTVLRALGLTGLPEQKNLVVFPFEFVESEITGAYADGLAETLARKLTSLERFAESLWVVPLEDVRTRNISTIEEARQFFGINLAVRGIVERRSDSVNVSLSVIDAESLKELRSGDVTDHVTNALALQDGLVLKMAQLLDLDLSPQARRVLMAGTTTVPGAYDYYVQARGYLQRYEQADQIDFAIGLFERALQEDPVYARAYAGLGEAYARKYEVTKEVKWVEFAERNCDKAIELDDELLSVYLTLGMLHTGTGRYGPAIADFTHVLDREPSNAAAYQGLAKAYNAVGRLDDAEEAYKTAISLKPNYWGGYNDLGVFYYNHARYEDAADQFLQVVQLTPDNAKGFRNLGGIYFYLERHEEAIEMFARSIEIEPTYGAYANLGTLYYQNQRYAEAARVYEEALGIRNTDFKVWGYLATALDKSGEDKLRVRAAREQAIALAEEKRTINPRDPDLLTRLLHYYQDIDEPDKARDILVHLESLDIDELGVEEMASIGRAHEYMGERDLALEWIRRALENGYSLPEIERDPGLDSLRIDERFKFYLQKTTVEEPTG